MYSEEERQKIINRFCARDVADMSPHQAYYYLLDEKKQYLCSEATLYRIFKAANLNTRRAPVRENRNRYRPNPYKATAPHMVWTWDITYFRTSRYTGRFYYAYVIVDLYSRYIVSAKVYDADNAKLAGDFLGNAFEQYDIRPDTLVVHSDNGASMRAASTMAVLKNRGVEFSHSRPRVSNDNPYSESLFRTLKYDGTYRYPAGGFDSVEQAQKWLDGFVLHYNEGHRHRSIRMVTPGTMLRGEHIAILRERKKTIEKARKAHPERWIMGVSMCCEPCKEVWLNPDNENPPAEANQQGGRATLFAGVRSRTAPIRTDSSVSGARRRSSASRASLRDRKTAG